MFKNWGLKKQFATVFIVLITLPTLLFGCIIYFQTTNTFKQQVEDNTMDRIEVNEQTLQSIIHSIENISSFMIYDDNFRSFFTMSAAERKHADYSQIVKGIKGYFTFQLMSFDYIDSITLKAKDGDTLEFGNTILGTEKWLEEEAAAKKGAIHWSNSYSVSTSWSRVKNVSSLIRFINDINQINEPIGMVTIRLDSTKLFKMIEKSLMHSQVLILLYLTQGMSFYMKIHLLLVNRILTEKLFSFPMRHGKELFIIMKMV